MTAELTADQSEALAGSHDLLELVDPATHTKYVLVPSGEYERLKDSSLDPHDVYRATERAFAEGWSDPKLDDYDRYEELRK